MILLNILLSQTFVSAKPAGWSEDINLSIDDDKDSRKPTIDVYEDKIHVIWMDQRHYPVTNRPEIYYKNSTNGGKTWNPEVRLTFSDSTKDYPRMAISGNNIHIIWTDDRDVGNTRIYYKNSTDGGNTWSDDKRISPLNADASGQNADIAVYGNIIHVVYPDANLLNYINSTDNGDTWSEPQQLTSLIRDSQFPAIVANGSVVHIAWMDHYDRFGNPTMGAIFYINSTDNGISWAEDFNITPMDLDASYPDIAVEGDKVHVTYGEERSSLWQIYYRRSEDNGITWSEEFMLSNSTEDLSQSVVKVRENAIFTLWSDKKDPIAEVYLRNSSDNGQNWDNEIRLTYDPAACAYSNIAVGNESLHLVWSDWRGGAPEIYYKYYPYYFPPTNLTIHIQGTNLTLNWSTPQDGPCNASYYLIYRSDDPNDFDFLTPWINTSADADPVDGQVIDLRTSFNHTGAAQPGHANYSHEWYYIIRAVYEDGEIDENGNIVGKYVIPMNKGWNMFSLPLAQFNTSISEVLKSIEGEYNSIWCYDAKEDMWRSSTDDLTDINRTMGLWIHMKHACNLSVVGAVPESTNIALYEGWNLVGYPSLITRPLGDALGGIDWTTVWTFDASDSNDPWKLNDTSKPVQMNDLGEMRPGCGYWVHVTVNDTWSTTRTDDNDGNVIWRVYGLDEGCSEENIDNPLIKDTKDYDKNDNLQNELVPERPMNKTQDDRMGFSFVPLIILLIIFVAEIKLFSKFK